MQHVLLTGIEGLKKGLNDVVEGIELYNVAQDDGLRGEPGVTLLELSKEEVRRNIDARRGEANDAPPKR